MSAIDDGGPAFPFKYQVPTTGTEIYYGMTLRDYFAGQVVCGRLSLLEDRELQSVGSKIWERVAVNAYKLADAMIAERNKETPKP